MYGCERWTIKKAEHRRIDAFELWCWRSLLRVPCTARRSNWSILKDISPGCSLEGLMLKLKLQYFGHLMRRADSLEKTWCWERLMVGGEGDDRGWDGWMASPTQWTWVWVNSGLVMDREAWRAAIHGVAKSRTRLSNGTELNLVITFPNICSRFFELCPVLQSHSSLTQWTGVWANSRRWWWTGKPDELQSMELQRVGDYWVKEQQQQSWRLVLLNINCPELLATPWHFAVYLHIDIHIDYFESIQQYSASSLPLSSTCVSKS